MMNDLEPHDDVEARVARAGLHLLERTAEYRERSVTNPARAPRARSPLTAVAMGAVAAGTVAVAMLAVSAGRSAPDLAWSPDPSAPTANDELAARSACTVEPDEGRLPERGERNPDAPVDPRPPITELPPLVSLDLRGTGGMATFADTEWVVTCMLLRDGDGFERGPVVAEQAGLVDGLGLTVGASTTWADGTSTAMLAGSAPAGTVTVEVAVPGLPIATAQVTDGRFGIWWIGSLADDGAPTVRALDGSGAELASLVVGAERKVPEEAVDRSDGVGAEGEVPEEAGDGSDR